MRNIFLNLYFSCFQADFDGQLEAAGDKLVIVDFHATWCGPCKMIAPKLEEFSKTYSEKVLILKVNIRLILTVYNYMTRHK